MEMNDFIKLVDSYSIELSKELSEMKIMNVKEIQAKLSLRILFIMKEVSESVKNKKQIEYDEIKSQLANKSLTAFQSKKIMDKLRDLKPALSLANRQHSFLNIANNYTTLLRFLKDRDLDLYNEFNSVKEAYRQIIIDEAAINLKKNHEWTESEEGKKLCTKMGYRSRAHPNNPISHKDEK